jgi:hypothetical protein
MDIISKLYIKKIHQAMHKQRIINSTLFIAIIHIKKEFMILTIRIIILVLQETDGSIIQNSKYFYQLKMVKIMVIRNKENMLI